MSKLRNHLRASISVSRLIATIALTIMLTSVNTHAHDPEVFATDLKAPTKIIFTSAGNLLVAESGDGPNAGRVSVVDRGGNRRTLLDGLPAGLGPPNNEPAGAEGLALRGRTLFIAVSTGDVIRRGPRPGTVVPNPNGPSSPILSSVLAVHFSSDVDSLTGGFALTLDDHFTLADGLDLTKENEAGDRARIELLTDFRDYVPDPRTIVRQSHPFGLALAGNTLFVVDAGMNTVMKVNLLTGRAQTLVRFAPLQNPLFPGLGPPVIEAVPDSIRLFGDYLLVTFLTGSPFPPGAAQVRRINIHTGSDEPFITGLASAIDVLPVRRGARFFVLEYSANLLAQAPGRLLQFDSPSGPPVVITDALNAPTSMARDPFTGDLFVTEIFANRIVRVRL